MRASCKLMVMMSTLLLLAFAALYLAGDASAAAEGKISGTIKLDGTAPHQKPIDMAKEPFCAKEHASKPVTTETVVAGPNGGLQNVVVYISEGLPVAASSQVPSETPSFDQKGCQYIPHVLALDVGANGGNILGRKNFIAKFLQRNEAPSRRGFGTVQGP